MVNSNDQKAKNLSNIQDDGVKKSSKGNSSFLQHIRNNPVLTTILTGLLVVVVVYLWKDTQGKRQREAVIKTASEQIETNQIEMLKMLAKPFVWSIRTEMLRDNLEQVNILITDMVREKHFRYIHLIDPNGQVILSTNKRLEGQAIGNEIDTVLLNVESPTTKKTEDNIVFVAAPVMGVDRRIGTLIYSYEPVLFNP